MWISLRASSLKSNFPELERAMIVTTFVVSIVGLLNASLILHLLLPQYPDQDSNPEPLVRSKG